MLYLSELMSNSHWCEASLMQFWSQWKTEANPSLTLEAGSLGRRMLQGIEEARDRHRHSVSPGTGFFPRPSLP